MPACSPSSAAGCSSCWPACGPRTGSGPRRARGGPSWGCAVTWSVTIWGSWPATATGISAPLPRPGPRRTSRSGWTICRPNGSGPRAGSARAWSPTCWRGPARRSARRSRARTRARAPPRCPGPAWLDQARELSEYWIHRQQIRQALARPSDLRADLAGPVLDGLRWAYPYRLAGVPAQPGDTVTISVTGPLTRTWHLVAAETGWQFADQPGPRLAANLAMTAEQAWRLLTNNLPAAGQADLTVSGDVVITAILLRTRAIIGTPKWGSATL